MSYVSRKPSPTLETYKYQMPGEAGSPIVHLYLFDLENAASIAGMFLTTECVIVEKKEDKPEMPMGAPGMGGMGGMM